MSAAREHDVRVAAPDLQAVALPSDDVQQVTVWPAVAETSTGCWVFGGIDPSGEVSDVAYQVTQAGVPPVSTTLQLPRYGARAAELGSGPLAGSVLVGGGLTRAGDALRVVRGAELLRP